MKKENQKWILLSIIVLAIICLSAIFDFNSEASSNKVNRKLKKLYQIIFKPEANPNIIIEGDFNIDPLKIGVFGLPDNKAAKDLGIKWTRIAAPQWDNYNDKKSKDEIKKRFKGLNDVNVIATIRANSENKTNCLVDLRKIIEQVGLDKEDVLTDALNNPGKYGSCMPKNIDEYLVWVRQTVKDLKKYVVAWQIENEVYSTMTKFWWGDSVGEFDNFIKLFKVVSREIKVKDPGKTILAPGIALGLQEFDDQGKIVPSDDKKTSIATPIVDKNVKKLFSEACNSFDVVDIHLYHTIESIPNRILWLKNIMNETNCVKPIWTTETSGPNYKDPAFSAEVTRNNLEQKQAEDLPERLETMLNSGVEKAIYFLYQDAKSGKGDAILNTLGLLDKFGNKKQAYFVMQQIMGKN